MEQQAQQQAMIAQLGPEAMKQLGNNLTSTQVADTQASAKIATSPQQAEPQETPA
jgi:hypothetical protein